MTKDMLRKKEHYSLRMQETQKKLERSIVIQQNVQCQMERIISCSEEINRNSSFEIEI